MPRQILLVEDHADIRTVFREGLRFLGMDVTAVATAEDALKKIQHQSFDCILLDINLPGMSGWDFAKKLRGQYNETPIIALTAAANVGSEQKALGVGCNAFLAKPCEPLQIKQKIEEVLSKGRSI